MSQSHPVAALVRWLDCFSEWTGRTVAWMTLLMVLGTFVVVVQRYVFNQGNTALQESIIYMHSLVFLLGAAYTLKHDGHVRVDIIYRPLGEKGKAWINLFGTLFLLLPVCIFIFWMSWDYVASSWSIKEASQESGGLAYRYLLKTALLVMPAMMILQGLAELLRSLLVISGYAHLPAAEEEHAL